MIEIICSLFFHTKCSKSNLDWPHFSCWGAARGQQAILDNKGSNSIWVTLNSDDTLTEIVTSVCYSCQHQFHPGGRIIYIVCSTSLPVLQEIKKFRFPLFCVINLFFTSHPISLSLWVKFFLFRRPSFIRREKRDWARQHYKIFV